MSGIDVSKLRERVANSSSRLQSCLEQAACWLPKLKNGMEALQSYKHSFDILQQWMSDSDLLLQTTGQDNIQSLISSHQVLQ